VALFPRRKSASPSQFELPAPYHLKASTFTFEGDDGHELETVGYLLYDDNGEVFSRESSPKDAGIYVIWAAGITHQDESQAACFAPGAPVILRPDPTNRFDPLAIQILDRTGRRQLGFVPKSDHAALPSQPERMPGVVMTEYRRGGRRVGATVVFVGDARS